MRYQVINVEKDTEKYGLKDVNILKVTFERPDKKKHTILYRECKQAQFSETFEFGGKFWIIHAITSIGFSRRPSHTYLEKNSRIMTQIFLQTQSSIDFAQRS